MFKYFKYKNEFEMIDLGIISYFLDIEIIQDNEKNFISQKKLCKWDAKEVFMEYCHFIDNTKLTKED